MNMMEGFSLVFVGESKKKETAVYEVPHSDQVLY